MKTGKQKVQVDLFQQLYNEILEKTEYTSDSELMTRDLTELFWQGLIDMIHNKELLNIAVRGQHRKGKSTVALKIMWEINKYLMENQILLQESPERANPKQLKINYEVTDSTYKPKKIRNPEKEIKFSFGSKIAADQTEFLRMVMNNQLEQTEENVMLMIDEFSRVAATGANATTESALLDFFSDVCASQFKHRIAATPSELIDRNTVLILDVKGRGKEKIILPLDEEYKIKELKEAGYELEKTQTDKFITMSRETMTTHCLLKYKSVTDGTITKLGRVDIYIGDLLKEPFYEKYRLQKSKRQSLTTEQNIPDLRLIERAGMILHVLEEMKPLIDVGNILHSTIESYTDRTINKLGLPANSFLGKAEIVRQVEAIIDLKKQFQRYQKQALLKNKDGTPKHDPAKMILAQETIKEAYQSLLGEQKRLKQVYDEYRKID